MPTCGEVCSQFIFAGLPPTAEGRSGRGRACLLRSRWTPHTFMHEQGASGL